MDKFRKLCHELGRDPRKTGMNFLMVDIALLISCLVFFFFFHQPVALIFGFALISFFDLFLLNGLQKELDALKAEHEDEFVVALGVFRVFAANHYNVYNAFSETRPFVSVWMQGKLEILLKDIDEDKTVTPFITFSRQFRPLIIEQVMTSVYQIVDGGSLYPLTQFSILFDHYAEDHLKETLRKQEERFDSMNAWPLIGAGLLAVAIIIGVVQIIGGVIHEL